MSFSVPLHVPHKENKGLQDLQVITASFLSPWVKQQDNELIYFLLPLKKRYQNWITNKTIVTSQIRLKAEDHKLEIISFAQIIRPNIKTKTYDRKLETIAC